MCRKMGSVEAQSFRSTDRSENRAATVAEKQSSCPNRSVGSWIDAKLKPKDAGETRAEAAQVADIAVPQSGDTLTSGIRFESIAE